MAAKGQSLRPSQFITTFGPGSILETPDGPVVIAAPGYSGLFDNNVYPDTYEIRDLRLSQALLGNKRIFRIPSNAELGVNENRSVYNTYHFPRWSLCASHGVLYNYQPQALIGCPRCPRASQWGEVWAKSRQEAVRFVLACPAGHLDEVSWRSLIRHRNGCSRPDHLLWRGGGSALRNINLECPECHVTANFGEIYSRTHNCSGRFPEQKDLRVNCTRDAKIVQRGAANLRVSEVKSALTIPPLDTALHNLLQRRAIVPLILAVPISSKAMLMGLLASLVQGNQLDPTTISTVDQYEESRILAAINDIRGQATNPTEKTEASLRNDEFDSLRTAASEGHPPERSDTPGGPNQFEVYIEDVRQFSLPSGRPFALRITPLSRLRVVMAQVGYSRPIGDDEQLVAVEYTPPNESTAWYPGIELFGEGVFLDLISDSEPRGVTEHFQMEGQAHQKWLAAFTTQSGYDKIRDLIDNQADYLHPVFVWWHTLAHRLMTALSVDSGYSSAAIRERVYCRTTDGRTVGGLLLYTAQSGGDGTLGGLIGLVPHFERILRSALRDVDACSNDPICIEEEFGEDRVNGAACYACQLVSETSCEHRNMLLDRKLLLENQP